MPRNPIPFLPNPAISPSDDPVNSLEQAIAAICGVPHALAVNSGTSALQIALTALGVGNGDEVLTTPFPDIRIATAITQAGAKPAFVEIDPHTLTMDFSKLESAITARTRAIVAAHSLGQIVDVRRINQIARQHELLVIEDLDSALGGSLRGRPTGSYGHIATVSFAPGSNLAGTGPAGMLLSEDAEYVMLARQLSQFGQEKSGHFARVGSEASMAPLTAAHLRAQVQSFSESVEKRQQLAGIYRQKLNEAGLLNRETLRLPHQDEERTVVLPAFVILTDQRDELCTNLAKEGIETRIPCHLPMHQQECFRLLGYFRGDFPESEKAARQSLALPLYPDLDEASITRIVSVIAQHYA